MTIFIDLKQNTPEDDRLNIDIFVDKNVVGTGVSEEYISRLKLEQFQSEQTYLPDKREIMSPCDDCDGHVYTKLKMEKIWLLYNSVNLSERQMKIKAKNKMINTMIVT